MNIFRIASSGQFWMIQYWADWKVGIINNTSLLLSKDGSLITFFSTIDKKFLFNSKREAISILKKYYKVIRIQRTDGLPHPIDEDRLFLMKK